MKTTETYEVKLPTWALSALINGDYSGIEDNPEDVELVENFQRKFANIANPQKAYWNLSAKTYEDVYKLSAEELIDDLQIEFLAEKDDYADYEYYAKRLERLCALKAKRNEELPAYFSNSPEFGLPCEVQDYIVTILGE